MIPIKPKQKTKKTPIFDRLAEKRKPRPPDPVAQPQTPASSPVVRLTRVVVAGAFFQLENGERWSAIESSDFALFANYLHGEDIAPVIQQRKDIGFNLLRVFGMCTQAPDGTMFDLIPSQEPTYFEKLPAFLQLLRASGMRIEFTVFAGARFAMPDPAEQDAFYARIVPILREFDDITLLELVNENDQSSNRIDTDRFSKPDGLLSSHGSNGSQALPVRPWWDYETSHWNDASEGQRKASHNSMEYSDGTADFPGSHVPVLANETTRSDKGLTEALAYDTAEGCTLLCSGSCFHSPEGKQSRLFGEASERLARAWVRGATAIPLDCVSGGYEHLINEEGPDDLRVYRRGGRAECLVRIRR